MAEKIEPPATVVGEEDAPHLAAARERVFSAAGDAMVADELPVDAEAETVAAIWLFQPDVPPRQVELPEVPALVTVESNLVWIDIARFDERDIRVVGRYLSLRPDVIESMLTPWSRPRLAILSDRFHVSVTLAELDPAGPRLQARQMDLVVGKNFLLSAHHQPLPFYDAILSRAAHDPDLVRLDSAFMLYIVLEELLGYFEALDEAVQGDIEEMQIRALRDSGEEFLTDLLQFKRFVFALSQVVQQHHPVFQAFLRPDFPYVSEEEVHHHFRSLEERLTRLIDRLDMTRQEVNTTFDIYLSRESHRTNSAMKVLTMVATVLFTATFIEGFFSPTFRGIPSHTAGGFAVMVVLIAVVAATTLGVFRWRGWM
jgi:magnesium transporter